MGLIGELFVLEHRLLPVIGPSDAVQAWKGPIGAPKDFQVGLIGIEAKARSPHVPTVQISSAEQLDIAATGRLFLHVADVSAASGDPASLTITEVATRIRDTIAALDMSAAIQFEERLSAYGLDWSDDYSDNLLLVGGVSLFEVLEGFPRITPLMFHPGVEDVHYAITLSRCESFRIAATALTEAITGITDDR